MAFSFTAKNAPAREMLHFWHWKFGKAL